MSEISARLSPFTEDLQKAINHHIYCEFQASFAYYEYTFLAYSCAKEENALHGFKQYFHRSAIECLADANAFMHYQCQRGGDVELREISAPKLFWGDPIGVFEKVLEMEKCISEDLYKLDEIADKCGDRAACSFIESGFLEKETRHVKTTADLLRQMKRVQGEGVGLFNIDKELRKNEGKVPWSNCATEVQEALLNLKF
ncbi:14843_t:CDS:2 [Acaulospora morrowiae]|uniref:Ferritin n=1 Tax=Acaulospora morrowiae TaxID=94023 RepID=A0A9N8ZAN8_9GLOM|nr:14843_t:CDS:2 [Acaulospora morrowiae]